MEEVKIKFTRLTQPLNKFTFKAPKIRKWVIDHCSKEYCGTLNLFSGPTELNISELRVDIDPNMHPNIMMEACDFVERWGKVKPLFKFKTVLIDPPYSYRKSMELYNGHRNSRFKRLLDSLPKILEDDGRVITFGYHSSVMSEKRGFKIVEICLISHGGAIHDTIATVEERI